VKMKHAEIQEIEIGLIELRYEHTRIHNPQRVASLAKAMERCGQIIPVITVKGSHAMYVLIDGYLRVAAMKQFGRDTVMAEIWFCNEAEALVQVLMKTQERQWDVLEQAYMIKELQERHQLSQDRIAALMGKDKSWVSRRVSLLHVLSDEILQMVRTGHVSIWAATRVLAPLARANPDHAKTLTASLLKEPIATRDLTIFLTHYQKANRKQRDNMVDRPMLFFKALHAKNEDEAAQQLKGGPEGKWVKDLQMASHILRRLIKQVPVVIYNGQNRLDRRVVMTAFENTRDIVLSLEGKIRRFDSDETCRDQTGGSGPASAGSHNPQHQSDAPCLQEYGASNRSGRDKGGALETFPLRGGQAAHSESIQPLPGQCGSYPGSPEGDAWAHGPLQQPDPTREGTGSQRR